MSTSWERPVRVLIGNSTAYNVTTLERAAELLMNDWPEGAGSLRAKQAIVRAMERPNDPGTAYSARQAFEAAAREADLLVERN